MSSARQQSRRASASPRYLNPGSPTPLRWILRRHARTATAGWWRWRGQPRRRAGRRLAGPGGSGAADSRAAEHQSRPTNARKVGRRLPTAPSRRPYQPAAGQPTPAADYPEQSRRPAKDEPTGTQTRSSRRTERAAATETTQPGAQTTAPSAQPTTPANEHSTPPSRPGVTRSSTRRARSRRTRPTSHARTWSPLDAEIGGPGGCAGDFSVVARARHHRRRRAAGVGMTGRRRIARRQTGWARRLRGGGTGRRLPVAGTARGRARRGTNSSPGRTSARFLQHLHRYSGLQLAVRRLGLLVLRGVGPAVLRSGLNS